MERQGHDFAASAMAYGQQSRPSVVNMQQQQQQQKPFGFHPQHQQFPSSVHTPPFLHPHPSMQQFPYHPHMQQQLHPHGPPPYSHFHPQQPQQGPLPFSSHYPPATVSSGFYNPYESPPVPAPPPSDPELHKRIDKTVEYAAKNGHEFEAMIREKQKDNPAYDFLFGGEGHNYYRYMLWMATHPPRPFNPPFLPSMPVMHPPPNSMLSPSPLNGPPLNASAVGSSGPVLPTPQMNQSPYPPFYDQQHPHQHPPFGLHGRTDYDQSVKSSQGPSGPLPSDVLLELGNIINNLNGTKESIKGAKIWFMQRSSFLPALVEALRDRLFVLDDVERQLHIIYLANDILFDSLNRRVINHELDNEALAFKPTLGCMLGRVYHNPQSSDEYRKRLLQMVEFWAAKNIFDQETISVLKGEMIGGPHLLPTFRKDLSGGSTDPSAATGLSKQPPNLASHQWQSDMPTVQDQDHPETHATPEQATQPPSAFTTPVPEQLPPYPLFPPGLIPGMVRKMQIGSGVPYSSLSPLDIPTVIPPSTVSQSEILQSVSKFFKEIGEVNPSEGPMASNSNDEDDDAYNQGYDREPVVRKGGACIPPPPNLQVDPETGAYADGSVDRKPGSNGRLGLGAAANPNEVSQYDDVYTSYRKQRSTNYHSSMSARASATAR